MAYLSLIISSGLYATQNESSSGLYGKALTTHNSEANISFQGDQGFKKDDVYDLIGHVVLQQDDTTLTSQTARIYNSEKRAVAKGNVKIIKKAPPSPTATSSSSTSPAPAPAADINAQCDEVELRMAEHTLILRGQAKVWRADEFVHADIITIDTDTGDISLQEPRGTIAAKKNVPTESKP